MIIIEVAGGLGNQMFQYALYQKYLHMGKLAKLDLFSYENPKSMPFELDLFHLPYDVDTKKELCKVTGTLGQLSKLASEPSPAA